MAPHAHGTYCFEGMAGFEGQHPSPELALAAARNALPGERTIRIGQNQCSNLADGLDVRAALQSMVHYAVEHSDEQAAQWLLDLADNPLARARLRTQVAAWLRQEGAPPLVTVASVQAVLPGGAVD